MKNLWILFSLLCLSAFAETDVTISLQDQRISASPYAYRAVSIQPMGVPTANQTSIILGNQLLLTSDQNGNIVISNQFGPMLYKVTVMSPPAQESFKYIVQSTNLGAIFAANNLVASDSATYPAGSVAWSISASDARYVITNNQGVVYGTVTNALGYVPMFTNGNLWAWAQFSTNALGAGGASATNAAFATNAASATNAALATNAIWAANATNAINATNYVGPIAYATNGSGISGNGVGLTNVAAATAKHLLSGDTITNLTVSGAFQIGGVFVSGGPANITITNSTISGSPGLTLNGSVTNNQIWNLKNGFQNTQNNAGFTGDSSGLFYGVTFSGGNFIGNGGNLTNLNSLSLTNVIPNSLWPLAAGANVTLSTNAGGTVTIASSGSGISGIAIQNGVGNLTTLTNPTFTGTANAATMQATSFIGDGFQITDLNANNLSGNIYATNLPIGAGVNNSTASVGGSYISITTNTHNYQIAVLPEWHNYLTNTGANSTNETTWGTFHAQNAVIVGGTINGNGLGITNLVGTAINSGTVPVAFLGSNTPSANTVLLGNGTWVSLTNLSAASNNLFVGSYSGFGTNEHWYNQYDFNGGGYDYLTQISSGTGLFPGHTPSWPLANWYMTANSGSVAVADLGSGHAGLMVNHLYAEAIVLDGATITEWSQFATNGSVLTQFPYTAITNSPWPTNLESLQWTFQSLQATGAFYGSFVGTLTNPGIVGPFTFSAPIILTNNSFTNWDGRYFQSNVVTATSIETTTNGQLRLQDQYGTVVITGTNGVLSIAQTNGMSFLQTNGNLTISGNITAGGTLAATTNGLNVGGQIYSGLGMPTNVAQYFHPSSNTTNQFVVNTPYTNLPQRSLLVGSAVLTSVASVTINYTNGGLNCLLPIQTGGLVTNMVIPFSVPLGSNATFSAVGTGGGYITNTMLWGQ